MGRKYVDLDGLSHFKSKMDNIYVGKQTGKGLSTNDYTNEEKTKLAGLSNYDDTEIRQMIAQASGAIDTIKVNNVEQTITNKTVNITVPTATNDLINDSNYQTDTDVENAINSKISSVYKPKGSIAFANLPALQTANEGFVYDITNSFTTTADFVEGAGKSYPAGTNVVIINNGTEQNPVYKYDVLSGFIDLSHYVLDSDLVAITNAEIDAIFA